MRVMAVVIVLAGCGQQSESSKRGAELVEEVVNRRRIALGLEQTPLRFKKAMQRLHALDIEAALERERDPERLREHALRAENLLQRARGELSDETKEPIRAATALAHTPTRAAATRLLEACTACHVKPVGPLKFW